MKSKQQKCWIGKIWLVEELFYYQYPFLLPDFFQPKTPKDEVLKQVLAGLESVNQSLGTNYKLSQIYYVPSSDRPSSMYQSLIRRLIIHYHSGNEFKEV